MSALFWDVAQASAGTTNPAVAIDASVFRRVGVTLRTMSFPNLSSCQPFTAQDIFSMRNRLQVGRIHAMPYPAKVIEIAIVSDGSDAEFVGDSMGIEAGCAELRVSSAVNESSPQPTSISLVNETPEPLLEGHRQFWPEVNLNGAMAILAVVMGFAKRVCAAGCGLLTFVNSAVHVDHATPNMVGG